MTSVETSEQNDGLESIDLKLRGTNKSLSLWTRLIKILTEYSNMISFTYQVDLIESSVEIRVKALKPSK